MADNAIARAEKIAERAEDILAAAGFQSAEADKLSILLCAQHVEQEIRNFCNVPAVPDELMICAAQLAIYEFISSRRAMGMMEGFENIKLEPVLKQLQEGDTNMVFATDGTASPEQRLEEWLSRLRSCRADLIAFRRLRW